MSWLGVLAGLGDGMAESNRRRQQQEAADRDAYIDSLMKVAESEDWPEAARVRAHQARMRVLSDPKFNVKKHGEKEWAEILRASTREVSGAADRNAQRTSVPALQSLAQKQSPIAAPATRGIGNMRPEEGDPSRGGRSDFRETLGVGTLDLLRPAPTDGTPGLTAPQGMLALAPPQQLPDSLTGTMPSFAQQQTGQRIRDYTALGAPENVTTQGPFSRGEKSEQMMEETRAKYEAMYGAMSQNRPQAAPKVIMGNDGRIYRVDADSAETVADTGPKQYAPDRPQFRMGNDGNIYELKPGEATPLVNTGERQSMRQPIWRQVWDPAQGMHVWLPQEMMEPGMPVGRQTFALDGTPFTGGTPGVSTTPPPNVPMGTQSALAGLSSIRKQIAPIGPIAKRIQSSGPVMGRFGGVVFDNLGGMNLDPDTMQLYIRLDTLFATRAFEEGGKNLTGHEKVLFESILPRRNDTLRQIIEKLNTLDEYIKNKEDSVVENMPARQREQIRPTVRPAVPGVGQGKPSIDEALDALTTLLTPEK